MYEILTFEFKPHLCDTYPTRLGTGAQNAPYDSCKLTSLLIDCAYVWFLMFPFRIGYRGFAEAVLICKPYIFSGNALIWNFVSQIYLFAINVHFPSLIHIFLTWKMWFVKYLEVKFTSQNYNNDNTNIDEWWQTYLI